MPPKGKGPFAFFFPALTGRATLYHASGVRSGGLFDQLLQHKRAQRAAHPRRKSTARVSMRASPDQPQEQTAGPSSASSGHFVASPPGSTSRRPGRPQPGGLCRDDKSNSGARQNSRLFSPGYSFTWAKGICENNCRSMIMFSRRSSWKNVAAFLPGNTWLTVGTYFKRSACACPSTSSQCRT